MRIKTFIIFTFLILIARLALAQSAPDPIRVATGARTLGMGKSFVGLADDISSIFLNPAGLANVDRPQLTSMSGKLLEEFNYLSLSGLYPTSFGNFGVAYIRSDIGGAYATTVESGSDPDDPIYIIDLTQDPMSYSNNLLIASYGDDFNRFLNLPFLTPVADQLPSLRVIKYGLNLKFFSVSLTGDHITQGGATGRELDAGLQARFLPWLSLGANVQNILPSSMGGKLEYQTGWSENYPAVLKMGAAINAIGEVDSLYKIGRHTIVLLTDVDLEISRSGKVPPLMHLGLEWYPLDLLAIRAGIDQEIEGGASVSNNLTSGVGLNYGDFRFDYAFHQFAGAPGVDNHFFSFSYGVKPSQRLEKRLVAKPNNLTTFDPSINIEGRAVDPKITAVKLNQEKADLTPRGDFNVSYQLETGQNIITIEGFSLAGNLVAKETLTIVRLVSYPDIPTTYWAYQQINEIATLGFISGYPDGKFRPEGSINRAELSALLIRAKLGKEENIPPATSQVFADVPQGHWAAKYINLAAEAGIVKGLPGGIFNPMAEVSRAEGLAMIARFGEVKQLPYANQFADIVPRHWAAQIISGAYQEGLLKFLSGQLFEPDRQLTRAEAVELLYRTKPVANKLNNMINFEGK